MNTCALVLSLLTGAAVASAAELPKVGDPAPDFTATASDGNAVTLKTFTGKSNVLLYFYPKDDTPGCTKQACAIRDDFPAFKGLNVTVLGVSFDSVASHKDFIKKFNLPFLLLADTDKAIAKAYGVATDQSPVARRITFIIDKSGKIAYVNPAVNPATHSAEVREVLGRLKD